jgi:holin-like protein
MKYLRQFMIILIMYFLGVLLQNSLKLPIPGTILGLIILFIALYCRVIKIEMIEEVSEFLLTHMAFLFLPAGVGLMTAMGILSGRWIAFILIIVISTAVVWIVTAYSVKLLRKVL